jgi:hypothetical protein
VASVAGRSAASLAQATDLANSATSADTVNMIVRRDSSGSFASSSVVSLKCLPLFLRVWHELG